jgi:hypothetical protein
MANPGDYHAVAGTVVALAERVEGEQANRGKLIAYVFSNVVKAKVVKSMHGDSSGVRGAVILAGGGAM